MRPNEVANVPTLASVQRFTIDDFFFRDEEERGCGGEMVKVEAEEEEEEEEGRVEVEEEMRPNPIAWSPRM